jgi:hypothetical protein
MQDDLPDRDAGTHRDAVHTPDLLPDTAISFSGLQLKSESNID